jgi:mRNA interferase MazF
MTPNPGEVYLVDMGYEGKVRPVVVVSRTDPAAPRALCTVVPLTTQNRGSRCEVAMPKVPWLKHLSFANVQALATYERHELLERRGRFDAPTMASIKDAIRWALDL